jgi:hypothetical protein
MVVERRLAAVRTGFGLLLLLGPRVALGTAHARREDRWAVVYCRLLGLRQLLEAVVLARQPGRQWIAAGAAVDAIHALSAMLIAGAWPDRRRAATANALTATGFALEGARRARGTRS